MITVYNFYLISRKLYKKNIPLIPRIITYLIRIFFSAYIPYSADIGKSSFGYWGLGTVIHNRAKIGNYVIIGTNVTIGGKSEKTKGKTPRINNYVSISTGAKILGDVNIGNNVIIGANSVVLNDIPDNSIAVGIPARVIKTNIDIHEYVDFTKFWSEDNKK